jgi:hypothetical protein
LTIIKVSVYNEKGVIMDKTVFVGSLLLSAVFLISCAPVVLEDLPEAKPQAEAEDDGLSGTGTEDPANSGGMLLSISGLSSDKIEGTPASVMNYYELIAVNRDAPTEVEHMDTWRYGESTTTLDLSLPLIKNNTYYILLLGGNDGGGGGSRLL